ncbi:hypothetical protein [Bacillus sp. CGMCC 1.16541]|uniref:hypothetical protein n=1 Tax=Bacillus sp. CGMCC 1.16541 TaxID=2185143 RepID=UPI000D731510|nr:hypothetical protein [Bacillus sp. CGMCC 1.16541]
MRISGLHSGRFPTIRIQSKQSEIDVAVSYLISEDRKRIYLTIMDMTSQIHQKKIRLLTPDHLRIFKDEKIMVGTSEEAKQVEQGTALYIPYNIEHIHRKYCYVSAE